MVLRVARAPAGLVFLGAAPRYWCEVYPQIHNELVRRRRRAALIADPRLRAAAICVLDTKRGNIDGSAAFAAFAPRRHRVAIVRAQVAFQSAYDYVDLVAEQADELAIDNGIALHHALSVAVDTNAGHTDYYRHHPARGDGGYLRAIVETCQRALATLPSYQVASARVHDLAERIVSYQSLNLTETQGGPAQLADWAHARTPAGSGLRWWETAASAGSSLGIFALFALAAHHSTHRNEAAAVERAYFPWIGALHSLLDSLVDLPEDKRTGQPNLIEHYTSAEETASRLQFLAEESQRHARALPNGQQHTAILASMCALYLAEPEAGLPHAHAARESVLQAIGSLAIPAMSVLRARRLTRSLIRRGPAPPFK